jgi:transcription elongation factor Elf1
MKIMPQGDYYQWHCRRCNSGNLTLWMRFEEGKVQCRACQQRMAIPPRVAEKFAYSLL